MESKFRIELITKLSNSFPTDKLKLIDNILSSTLINYDINQKSTEVTLYQNDIPSEIKSFLVCKSMKGLTKSSLYLDVVGRNY